MARERTKEPKEPEVTCESCKALPAPTGELSDVIEDVERLKAPADFARFDLSQTDKVHRVKPAVLADYDFEAEVKCCLPDRQPHKAGLVVETSCGLTLNIGHICGGRHVAGYAEAKNRVRRVREYQSSGRLLKTEPQDLIQRLQAVKDTVRKLTAFRTAVDLDIPLVAKEMNRRTTLGGGKRTEVLYFVEGKGQDRQERDQLVGMELWKREITVEHLEEIRKGLERLKLDVDAEAGSSDLSRTAIDHLSPHLSVLRERSESLFVWAGDASRFLSETNLRLSLRAAEPDKRSWQDSRLGVTVEGEGYVVQGAWIGYGGKRAKAA